MERKLFLMLIVLCFGSCTKKTWSKHSLVQECLVGHKYMEEQTGEKRFSETQVKELCGCVADKMLLKYKSEDETKNDSIGARQLAWECKLEVLGE